MKTSKPLSQLLQDNTLVRLSENYADDNNTYIDYYEDFVKVFNPSPVMISAINKLCEHFYRNKLSETEAMNSNYTFDDMIAVGLYLNEQLKSEVA